MRAAAHLVALSLCLVPVACSSAPPDEQGAPATPPASATSAPAAPKASPSPSASQPPADGAPVVLAISIDGLNPEALTALSPAEIPALRRLIDQGASTLDARTSRELTITLPNHTGMMTGRRVDGPDGTSVTFNDDDGRTLEQVHGSYVPGMFDVAHDHGVRTALFAEKDKFRLLVRSWDRNHGADDVTGDDDGRDKLDAAAIGPAADLVDDVTAALRGDGAGLVFWHLAAPDAAGHANGWLTPAYLAAVREADRRIGDVLAALDADPALVARTTIVLTADHGGPAGSRDHGDATLEADYRVPFIVWGRTVSAGADLYDLDSTRSDPGTGRPGYSGPQPVRNLDVAATSLALLGLPQLPDTAGTPVVVR
ncbi:alkaline phosphatase family protein [Aeromicrobium fastidiosum]|uniref:alkaline phosphatase family protein n=1 Tax=Aeromicrobium fastidiosum TaxID=52699 RepID=UPI00165FFB0F|nr:alkaline phosphatase family protein [Aeromicrobium fastidiosum]MBP2388957.1 putative AlkP superfamily pyrophosphatase or phosphodiesterase [Aeromicrobium fastidiosum]